MKSDDKNWLSYLALLMLLSGCGGDATPDTAVAETPAAVDIQKTDPAPTIVADATPPAPVPIVDPVTPDPFANDSDHDGIANDVDNCEKMANPDQTNTDQVLAKAGVNVVPDGKGDACDDDPDGDGRNVVYIDGASGDDAATGYFHSPVKSLAQAMQLGSLRSASVWIAAGDYDVGGVTWIKGSQLFGGYPANFDPSARNLQTHATRLLAIGKSAVLFLQNLSTDTRFDGVTVVADAIPTETSGAIIINNSVVSLVDCTVTGDPKSSDDAAVRIQNDGFVTIMGGNFSAKGASSGVESTGMWSQDSTLSVSGATITAGDALQATALRADATTLVVDQSSFTAKTNVKTQQRATGIWLDRTAPKIINSKIIASGVLVEGIYFEKDSVPTQAPVIQNNSIYVGSLPNPLLRDWNGVAYTAIQSGDFLATFADGVTTQVFADLVGASNTGGNTVGNGN